ncbi:chorismate mutase [Eubacteriaceae bacterium ES2]|nr:chorismate mutase [Eubacteriaceae bacterium ES2]
MSIEAVRKKIDEIDDEMRILFEKRMDCVKEIIEYKYSNQEKIFDPTREAQMIENNTRKLSNPYYQDSYEKMLKAIMDLSKDYQNGWLEQKKAGN